LVAAAAFVVVWLVVGAVPALSEAVTIAEGRFVVEVASWRSEGFTGALASFYSVLFTWTVPVVGWGTVLALVTFRRWRHALIFLGSLLVVLLLTYAIEGVARRPRPYAVAIEGRWEGFAHPSWPIAAAAAVLTGAVLCLVPRGTWRRVAEAAVAVLLFAYGSIETYLGVSHPTDQLTGALIGITIPVLAIRWFAPDEIFPVSYRRGNTAHLDLTGDRGAAIRNAVEAQLGLVVEKIKPIGSEGSAGSTPMRLYTVDPVSGDVGPVLFAKLLARSHLRADRWYKLGRTLMYGRLEDESKFGTVRRLVQQEDYLGLRMAEAGIRVPKTYGIVEITPEREYMLVTEFLDGYQEIGDAEVDEVVIDNALAIVRRLWDCGLAHRDVKPANVMVRGHDVALIDVAFSQVRPSPWRQAVDLANMMLVLALRSSPELVYERAQLQFTPADIGEAFAASRSITLPSQVRADMKRDGRDLVARFRELAPSYPPISIQQWSWRRVALTAWVVLVAIVVIVTSIDELQRVGMLP
jgi:membrane-associated phospholipid phosphatase